MSNGEIGKYKIHTHTKVTGFPRTGTAILSEADLMSKFPNGGSYLMTTSDGVIYNYTNITYKNQIQNLINKRDNDKLRYFIVSPKNIINNDEQNQTNTHKAEEEKSESECYTYLLGAFSSSYFYKLCNDYLKKELS